MKLINLLLIILALLITAVNIFLVCQNENNIARIDERIKYLETRHDTEYIEEYLKNHKEE